MSVGEIMVKRGFVTKEILNIAFEEQKITGDKIGETVRQIGYMSEADLAQVLAEDTEMQFWQPTSIEDVDWSAVDHLGVEYVRNQGILPLALNGGSKRKVGVTDPYDGTIRNAVRHKLSDKDVDFVVIPRGSVSWLIGVWEGQNIRDVLADVAKRALNLGVEHETRPILMLADSLLRAAVGGRASDIHIEPKEKSVWISFRIDGRLRHIISVANTIGSGLVNAWKVRSGISEVVGQAGDGAFVYSHETVNVDIRVSVIPDVLGDSMVLRLHNQRAAFIRLEDLGFGKSLHEKINKSILYSNGIFLITGPTGSGKTTTLYSILDRIKRPGWNMVTVENPVECRLPFLRQTEVDEDRGWTFAEALRRFLRHDPDVILVGEIRDKETAKIAVEAAQTGHLVFSTLHTNSAVTVLPRLLGLGVDAMGFGALRGAMAQRLIPRLCDHCKIEKEIPRDEIDLYSIKGHHVDECEGRWWVPSPDGCSYCHYTGYRGRVVVGELIEFTSELLGAFDVESLKLRGSSVRELVKIASEQGYVPMLEAGIEHVRRGRVSYKDLHEMAA